MTFFQGALLLFKDFTHDKEILQLDYLLREAILKNFYLGCLSFF